MPTSIAIDRFRNLPAAAIKGVGPEWTAVLSTRGVRTVGDVAGLSDAELYRLTLELRSRHPVQLRTLARSLDVAVPAVPKAAATDVPLYDLVGVPPDTLEERMGDVDGPGLATLLSVAYTVLNTVWLQRLTVASLMSPQQAPR
jgi:hypothetical protein